MVVWGCLGVSAHSTVRLLDIDGRLREGFDEMTTPNKICRRWSLGTGSALDVVPVRVVVTVAWMAFSVVDNRSVRTPVLYSGVVCMAP